MSDNLEIQALVNRRAAQLCKYLQTLVTTDTLEMEGIRRVRLIKYLSHEGV